MRPMLTTPQLADRWQTSERHVERMRVAGTGPRYVRFGKDKAVRYPPEEVEAWEAAQLVSSTSEEVAAGRRSHKVKTQIEIAAEVTPQCRWSIQTRRRNALQSVKE